MTDRLTEQWGVEGVVVIVAMGTQDTFNLHIWGHEWGRGNLWKKLLPWLLPSRTQRTQVQSVGNIDAHVCAKEDNSQKRVRMVATVSDDLCKFHS